MPPSCPLNADALEKAEQLGEEGDVDGAQVFSQQAEVFSKQKEAKHRAATEPERTMTVCDICGVFINSTDNEARRRVGIPPRVDQVLPAPRPALASPATAAGRLRGAESPPHPLFRPSPPPPPQSLLAGPSGRQAVPGLEGHPREAGRASDQAGGGAHAAPRRAQP